MDITAIAMILSFSYGSLGIVFWAITQIRLSRVEKRVSDRIIKAVDDIQSRVSTELEAIDTKYDQANSIENPSILKLKEEITDSIADLAEAMREELPLTVSQSMRAQILEMKGEQTKLLQGALTDSGVADAVTAQAEEYIAQLSPEAKAAMDIGSMKLSAKYLRDNPVVGIFAKMVQSQAAQYLANRSPEMKGSIGVSSPVHQPGIPGRRVR